MQDLALPGDVTPQRFASRQNLLDAVNDHFRSKEKADNLDAMDTFYQRAYGLIQQREGAGGVRHQPGERRSSATSTAATPPGSGS